MQHYVGLDVSVKETASALRARARNAIGGLFQFNLQAWPINQRMASEGEVHTPAAPPAASRRFASMSARPTIRGVSPYTR
jgi:hypothetical protein